MIIQRMVLKNFLTFYDEQTMHFPVNNGDAITVIIAPNNSGKTSIIRALNFLFYGFDNPAKESRAVNLESVRRARQGEAIESFVQITISNAGQEYTIHRSLKARKTGANNLSIDIIDKDFVMITHLEEKDKPTREEVYIDSIIRQMIPKGLFDFFFFKGEELAARLVNPQQTDRDLYEGLTEVLYKNKWENCRETLKQVQRHFSNKLKKASGVTKEFRELEAQKEEYLDARDTFRAARVQKEKEVQKNKDEYNYYDEQVLESIPEKNKLIKSQLINLKRQIKGKTRDIELSEQTLKDSIGRKAHLIILKDAFEDAYSILQNMQNEKLLPPDISEGLLSTLLKENKCICGADIAEGTKNRKEIQELRKRALATSVSDQLYSLHARLKSDSNVGYIKEQQRLITQIHDKSKKLDADKIELAEAEEKHKRVEKQYDDQADRNFKMFKKKRDEFHRKLLESQDQLGKIDYKISEIDYKLQQIDKKVKGIHRVPKAAKFLQVCEIKSRKIADLVDKIYNDLQGSFLDFTSKQIVNALYYEIVTDGSKAAIDKQTLLPSIIKRSGITGLSPGGGQQQTLVLAYIIALSELRKRINQQLKKYFSLKVVDDQCFFMDSVFAPMQGEYREKVASEMPGKMRQLVLLVAPQQWDKAVSGGLQGHVSNAYQLVLTTNKKIEGDDYKMDYYGKELKLVESIKKPVEAYTNIYAMEA